MASKTRKAATVADLAAAVALGTMDPSTEMVPVAEAERMARKAAEAAAANAAEAIRPLAEAAGRTADLPTTEHQCGIPGCRHGSAHTDGTHQPDRQVKLQCPTCGAVARMTTGAIRKAGGLPTCADGSAMAEAARRTYTRRTA